ncbi:MAG: ATP-binding cassette domain-containing protein [candidate division Zixibacteria bacterium]|nr:ATP-binding cassette domain-containing protein [candidate division Zixibacteria bacterium]
MITLENVTYRYRPEERPALLNVSINIKRGEAVCVMGANGSGKSTFAKLLAGLIKTEQGRYRLNLPDDCAIPVGLLFQNPDNQIIALTIEKEIAFALENQGIAQEEMEKRIEAVIAAMGIGHLRGRLTSELSTGEKQRLSLASLLVARPPVLVLDEPSSYLDKEGKELFNSQLEKIRKENPQLTLVHVTQYPQTAGMYERLIVFSGGRIEADGKPDEILADNDLCIRCGLKFDAMSHKEISLPDFGSSNSDDKQIETIELKRLSFDYPDGKTLIKNLNATFHRKEISAVVGPSGSGKSTLLMLLCSLLKPDSGELNFLSNSAELLNRAETKGKITAALQQPERQFFLNSCQEEVKFGPENLGMKLDNKQLEALFHLSGLSYEQFKLRDPLMLSLGEKRRLAFSAILAISPEFLIFDEPTCALDPEGVGRFILLAESLKKAGMGVIIITHDQQLVEKLADRILSLDGRGNYRLMSRTAPVAAQ